MVVELNVVQDECVGGRSVPVWVGDFFIGFHCSLILFNTVGRPMGLA